MTHSSPVDWDVGKGKADDTLEVAGVAVLGLGCKEKSIPGEEDCWAETVGSSEDGMPP